MDRENREIDFGKDSDLEWLGQLDIAGEVGGSGGIDWRAGPFRVQARVQPDPIVPPPASASPLSPAWQAETGHLDQSLTESSGRGKRSTSSSFGGLRDEAHWVPAPSLLLSPPVVPAPVPMVLVPSPFVLSESDNSKTCSSSPPAPTRPVPAAAPCLVLATGCDIGCPTGGTEDDAEEVHSESKWHKENLRRRGSGTPLVKSDGCRCEGCPACTHPKDRKACITSCAHMHELTADQASIGPCREMRRGAKPGSNNKGNYCRSCIDWVQCSCDKGCLACNTPSRGKCSNFLKARSRCLAKHDMCEGCHLRTIGLAGYCIAPTKKTSKLKPGPPSPSESAEHRASLLPGSPPLPAIHTGDAEGKEEVEVEVYQADGETPLFTTFFKISSTVSDVRSELMTLDSFPRQDFKFLSGGRSAVLDISPLQEKKQPMKKILRKGEDLDSIHVQFGSSKTTGKRVRGLEEPRTKSPIECDYKINAVTTAKNPSHASDPTTPGTVQEFKIILFVEDESTLAGLRTIPLPALRSYVADLYNSRHARGLDSLNEFAFIGTGDFTFKLTSGLTVSRDVEHGDRVANCLVYTRPSVPSEEGKGEATSSEGRETAAVDLATIIGDRVYIEKVVSVGSAYGVSYGFHSNSESNHCLIPA